MEDAAPASGPTQERFPPTRWSVVLAACDAKDPNRSAAALDDLCRAYWFPIYVYTRRRGASAEDAEDLTQGYFAALIQKGYLGQADRERGKLRCFLLTTLKHYLADEWSRAHAIKRGQGQPLLSLDAQAEQRYAREPADESSPDLLFDKRWALTLLDNVLAALRAEYAQAGQEGLFDALKGFLAWNSATETYRETAARLRMKESALRVAVFRLRRRYGDLLRNQVADTVISPEEVPAELEHLLSLMR